MSQSLAIVLTTVSNDTEAESLSDLLVKSNYAACVNILPNIRSKYFWKDKLQITNEVMLMIKTKKDYFKQLEKLIIANHSYQVPEILCINAADVSEEYESWVNSNFIAPRE